MSCLVTESLSVPEETNFPPSIVSPGSVQFPLDEIVRVDRSTMSGELTLDVVVRDPNIEQTLMIQVVIDDQLSGVVEQANDNLVPTNGEVERPLRIRVPIDRLGEAGRCHRIDAFASTVFGGPGLGIPIESGDVDQATWWIRLVDEENPEATLGLCP